MKSGEEISLGHGSLEEKAAGDSGNEAKIERSHSINLNSLPAVTAAAITEIGVLHGAVESEADGSISQKGGGESSGTVQKKVPKNEEVDEAEVQVCAVVTNNTVDPLNSENHVGEKDALAIVPGNEGCADGGDDYKGVQVLSIVKKDESEEDIVHSINPVTVALYREEKGASGSTSGVTAVRPPVTRSSCFHGVTR